jgi:hypothetical protein
MCGDDDAVGLLHDDEELPLDAALPPPHPEAE